MFNQIVKVHLNLGFFAQALIMRDLYFSIKVVKCITFHTSLPIHVFTYFS